MLYVVLLNAASTFHLAVRKDANNNTMPVHIIPSVDQNIVFPVLYTTKLIKHSRIHVLFIVFVFVYVYQTRLGYIFNVALVL